jgi:hypothetical protein
MYKIFCKSCEQEISWYTIPFYSVDFCNPQCAEDHHGKLQAKRHQEMIDQMAKRQVVIDDAKARASNTSVPYDPFEAQRRYNASIHFQETLARQIDQRRPKEYTSTRPHTRSPERDKWDKAKRTCQECGSKYYMGDPNAYTERFCKVECRNKDHKRKLDQRNALAREKRAYERSLKAKRVLCAFCGDPFDREQNSQKYCSLDCRNKVPIKRSNDYWLKRNLAEIEAKRAKRNRKIGEILNKDHVKKTEWTGKKFKAVRG